MYIIVITASKFTRGCNSFSLIHLNDAMYNLYELGACHRINDNTGMRIINDFNTVDHALY